MIKVWVYTMESKGEWCERFKEFQAFVQTHLEHKIKAFLWMYRNDSISKDFEVFFMYTTLRACLKTLDQQSVQIEPF